ncbi:MAG: hypothetical protein MJZ38_07215 [archaeon]|nr:hypothetical protein [archaeon]
MDCYQRELDVAVEAVRRAADRYVSDGNRDSEEKENSVGSYDIVTYSDVEAQESIVEAIRSAFPEDCFYCEESEGNELSDARTWVIDPIDGTLSYERGMPIYGTQLALFVDREPVLSVIYVPVLREMYTATRESGARLNGVPIGGNPNRDLKKCVVSTGDFSRKKQEWRDKHYELIGAMRDELARIRMLGAACCDFAFFTAGRMDIHIRFVNKLWDFMPGLFLARVSGAYVDEELLESKRFLLLTQTREEAEQFKERVLSKVEL